MGTVVGLVLGAGLVTIWWSFFPAPPKAPRRGRTWSERTQDLLVQAGVPSVSPAGLVLTSLGLGLVALVVIGAVTATPPIAVCFALMAAGAPGVLVHARARRRRRALRGVWPDVIDDLVSGIRAGMSLPEAVMSLADRGPEEVRPEFARFAQDYRATGRFSDSLDALKAHLADPVADRIVEALRLTQQVGGTDLGRLLRTLAQMLREDLRTRGELEARQSWTVNGARLAVAAPWLVLLLLSTRGETASAYNTSAGVLVLATGAGLSVLAYWLMVRLGQLPEERRVLR
ncbi:type II secretion system F family protein [Georgenia sp. 10Sc9-8]|uniref:Type II secretion system F family protein n=1 Tax=Georgenia halotolerans TaxID=3028317 RepID=A0ABT5TXX1_9MICO|nr:type II secretion system F family protein [Georgenia halotolerans]